MENAIMLNQPTLGGLAGVDGGEGATAYELAVQHGYSGTEIQYLEALENDVLADLEQAFSFQATWNPDATETVSGYGGTYQSLSALIADTPETAKVQVNLIPNQQAVLDEIVDIGRRTVVFGGNSGTTASSNRPTITIPTIDKSGKNAMQGGFECNGGRIYLRSIVWMVGSEVAGLTDWKDDECGICQGTEIWAEFRSSEIISSQLLGHEVSFCNVSNRGRATVIFADITVHAKACLVSRRSSMVGAVLMLVGSKLSGLADLTTGMVPSLVRDGATVYSFGSNTVLPANFMSKYR